MATIEYKPECPHCGQIVYLEVEFQFVVRIPDEKPPLRVCPSCGHPIFLEVVGFSLAGFDEPKD